MARSEEIAKLTSSLSLDAQSFVKELSNVKKQSRNLSKDFDIASKSIENAEDKMDAMTQALNKGERAIESNSKKLEMQNKQYDDLFKKVEKQVKAYNELKQQLNEAEDALSKMNKSDNVEAYTKQEKAVIDLRKALENKAELIQKNSHKLQQYSTDIDKTVNDMKKLERSMDDIKTSMNNMDSENPLEDLGESSNKAESSIASVVNSITDLAGVSKTAAAAITTIFTSGIVSGAISYDKAITSLRINLRLTEKDAKSLYDQIKLIADDGYSLEGVTQATTLLQKRFKLSNQETKDLAQSMELLDKMGYDMNDTVRFMISAVNDWGMTHREALDMIITGEQVGMNISQDWLDTLVEYTPILSTLGIEAKDAFMLIDEAINATGMNTDQATDMVKEFLLTLTDGSNTSKDAFKDLGINIDDLKKQIDDGSITTIDAMKKVSKAIMNVGDDTERARLLQEIFKGTVEYGSEGVIQAWANLSDEVINTSGAMDEAKQAYEESYEAMQQDLSNEWKELSQTLGSMVIPGLSNVMYYTNKVMDTLKLLPMAFQFLGNDIGNVFDGMSGKVKEFVLAAGEDLAGMFEFLNLNDAASDVRDWLKPVEEEHKALSERIRQRNEENARLDKEFSRIFHATWDDITGTYENIPEEVKTKFTVETEGDKQKVLDLYNVYEQLPEEVQTLISADNYVALEGAKTFEDVLKNIPTEKLVSILSNIDSGGTMTPETLQQILNALPEEERVKIQANIANQEAIKKTTEDIKNMPKETTTNVNVNTGDSATKTQKVKQDIEQLDGKTSTTKFDANTKAAQNNINALNKNTSDFDAKHTGRTKLINFSANTGPASRSVTALKANVSDFVSRFAKTFTTTFKVVTKYETQGSPTQQSSGAKPGTQSVNLHPETRLISSRALDLNYLNTNVNTDKLKVSTFDMPKIKLSDVNYTSPTFTTSQTKTIVEDNSSVNFHAPLIVVEGNADKNTVNSIEKVSDSLINEIIKKIDNKNEKQRRLQGR